MTAIDSRGPARRRRLAAVAACALGRSRSRRLHEHSRDGDLDHGPVESYERGPYLDVDISQRGRTWRYFAPAKEPCLDLLKPEAVVEYVNLGPLGQFQAGSVTCIPAGIGSLAAWRDERPRPPSVRCRPSRPTSGSITRTRTSRCCAA